MVDGRASGGRSSGHDVERRVFVKALPRRVWTTLHDPDLARRLLPELTIRAADPAWPAAGSIAIGEAHLGLLRADVRLESLEIRPDTAFRLLVTAAAFSIEWGWRLEPNFGGTRVVHDGTFELHDRWAGILVKLGRESIGALAEAHLRALKQHAEEGWGEATGPAA
jgi:polyketide cyclase/dehydrase/lipid transport protein